MNSREAIESANLITARFNKNLTDIEFTKAAFLQLLARPPSKQEVAACLDFLKANPERSQFVHVLLNHNDFQVIR